MKRSRLNPISKRKAAKDRQYAKARKKALERDGYTCQLRVRMDGHAAVCASWLPPETHHVLPRGRGGVHDSEGLVTVCPVAHRWIDEHPAEAELFGFLVSDKQRAIREVRAEFGVAVESILRPKADQ